ncbi:MAG: hypothetical protein Q4P84_00625 [Elusimicrobiales bacterium]|nr:hypothetical protein [Elusimicrobiales bacterium]
MVALADVYDALTSERVYKPAFSHDTAVQMILDGKCGAFNPLLLQCLEENEAALRADLQVCAVKNFHQREINKIAAEVLEKTMASAETATVK